MPKDSPGADFQQQADSVKKAHETMGDQPHQSVDDNLFKFMQDVVNQHASPLGKKLFNTVAKMPGGKDRLVQAAKGAFGMQPQGGGGQAGGPSKEKDDALSKLIKWIIKLIKALLKLLGINLGGDGPSMGAGQAFNMGQFMTQAPGAGALSGGQAQTDPQAKEPTVDADSVNPMPGQDQVPLAPQNPGADGQMTASQDNFPINPDIDPDRLSMDELIDHESVQEAIAAPEPSPPDAGPDEALEEGQSLEQEEESSHLSKPP